MGKNETINYGAQIIAQSLNKPDVIKFNDIGLREMSQIIEDMNKGVMESLYNEGYRKIEDDEIVIKKRQYEQLKKYNRDRKRLRLKWQQAKQDLDDIYSNGFVLLVEHREIVDQVARETRQETAREILQELTSKGTIHAEYDWNEYFEIDVDELKKLAKSRGIEFGG